MYGYQIKSKRAEIEAAYKEIDGQEHKLNEEPQPLFSLGAINSPTSEESASVEIDLPNHTAKITVCGTDSMELAEVIVRFLNGEV